MERSLFQRHENVTPRIARMLRELEDPDTASNRSADAVKPATDRGRNSHKPIARKRVIAMMVFIAAALVATFAWQARALMR
jgi:ferric-dicitrate binding protein FerR (iron transport regulator)